MNYSIQYHHLNSPISKSTLIHNRFFYQVIYLCNSLEVTNRLQLIDSMTFGFTVSTTFGYWALPTATTNPNTINNKPCIIQIKYTLELSHSTLVIFVIVRNDDRITKKKSKQESLVRTSGLTLFALEAQAPGFVGSWWSGYPNDLIQLSVLPAANTEKVSHNITLLLPVQFLHILIGSHSVKLNDES